MSVRLDPRASGLRHLRFAREVLATLEAHREHDARLDQEARDVLLEEAVQLRAEIQALSQAVKTYRDFLERTRTTFRGIQRVGKYLVATARDVEEREEAQAIDAGFEEAFANFEAKERAPRKAAVREEVAALRAHLDAMDERLERALGEGLVASLYPALTADASKVHDDDDDDDDSAGA